MLYIRTLFCLLLATIALSACGSGSSAPASSGTWANLAIKGANRQITLSWIKADKASGGSKASYTLYWSTTPGVTKSSGAKIANITSPYIHTGLTNDTMYYYVVTETVDGTEGPASLEVATQPRASLPMIPTGITIIPQNGSIQLKIDRTGATATTKYNLYWSTSSSFTTPTRIANAFGSSATFQHLGLTNGVPYYYAVSAETPEGEGARSKIIASTPLADAPAVNYVQGISNASIASPNAISISAGNQLVNLTWNMPTPLIPTSFNPNATPTSPPVISSFAIFWSTQPISSLTKITPISVPVTTATKYPLTFSHNTGLSNGTPYYYAICAVAAKDSSGAPLQTATGEPLIFQSPLGIQTSVTPEAKIPLTPVDVTATSGNQQVTLTWAKDTAANIVYKIYGSTVLPAKPEALVHSANLLATTTTTGFSHTGLQAGSYYYTVTASTEGESGPGGIVAVKLW